ncbi:EAL domain-containing protein [Saccharophagus sp. K07]|uniref:putative bifunctional diguanylate cyclase/phosphodiesterase n=1 Tax=Saccharophagus sp. K07 TaxID=2283636 RepID=UPI001651D11F|nr:EAL domain-containing protein [Saccharophagus sp. K07]
MVSLKQSKPILIIDDVADERRALVEQLGKYRDEFPRIVEADNIAEALLRIREEEPICCLIGAGVTRNEGLALLQLIRHDYPADVLSVIVVTDPECEDLAVDMLHHGAQDCLIRDNITPTRLYSAIWNAMRASDLYKQVKHLAHYDSLTGLLNRNLLMNRLEQALKRCDRYKQRCALLHLDIDHFKPVNETYGHTVGDELLQAVAERIRNHCRNTDSPARVGSDEFLILLENVDKNTGRKVADKLLKALEAPFELSGHVVQVGVSIGISTYPDTAKNAEELIKQADQALRRAKQEGIANFVAFSEQHRHQWNRQHVLETELPRAIMRGELSLVYQPIVTADSFELKRLEVLSRWPRSDYTVNALELMEMIDRLNLTEPFHEWLFNTAFAQLRKWRSESINPDLCLNIPANYCYHSAISNCVLSALQRHQVDPQKIELEITESTLMRFPDKSVRVLQGLHDAGLRIAVDDFGTGYSSMAYLTSFPLDTLKIDRNFFLADVNKDRNRKVIEAITALGHSLDLEIIAEGVETDVQLKLAKEVGCDLLQGYYFGRPEFPGINWEDYAKHFSHMSVPR